MQNVAYIGVNTAYWSVAPETLLCNKSRLVAGLEVSDCKVVVPVRVVPSHNIPFEMDLLMIFFHVCEFADYGLPGSDNVHILNTDAVIAG
jgi:hypothetical protein